MKPYLTSYMNEYTGLTFYCFRLYNKREYSSYLVVQHYATEWKLKLEWLRPDLLEKLRRTLFNKHIQYLKEKSARVAQWQRNRLVIGRLVGSNPLSG